MVELSIVIPTFNTAVMTLRCCRAVLASTPESSEVIVADDGSTDGTAELLAREAPSVNVVALPTNRGFAPAANAGVAAARGAVILLLNSDAVVAPDALQALLDAFDADPKLGVAGAQLLNEDGSPQWSGGRTPTLLWMVAVVSGAGRLAARFRRGGNSDAMPRNVDWVSGAAMAFRREVWRDAGPLDERFLFYCQDIELSLRATQRGWHLRLLDHVRVTHALGGTISDGNALRHDPERLWADLLTWGARYYGRSWWRRARIALVAAAALRVAWRTLRHPLRRDADTAAMRRGLRRLAQSVS